MALIILASLTLRNLDWSVGVLSCRVEARSPFFFFFFFFRMAYVTVGQRETVVKHPLQSNGPAWVERETAKGH